MDQAEQAVCVLCGDPLYDPGAAVVGTVIMVLPLARHVTFHLPGLLPSPLRQGDAHCETAASE